MAQLSCGYTTSSTLPAHLKTIHIEKFENNIDFTAEGRRNIYLPLLEIDVKNAIVDRFLFDGNLKVVDAPQADLILRGKLNNYRRSGLRFTQSDDVEEYRVHITVELKMWDSTEGVQKWTESALVGEATYFVSGSLATTEESAVQEAIEDLARRIVERTVEDW